MKHGEFGWGMIVAVILALVAAVAIIMVIMKTQSGSTSSMCEALKETFDSAIYGPLKMTGPELC